MKTILFVLILLISNIYSQQIVDKNLTVYGQIEVFADADRARITFSIKGLGESLENAFDNARNKMNSISKRLYEIGLNENNLSTSFFQSSENYGDKAFLSSSKDYKAVMNVLIITEDLELVEPILIILSESGIEKILNVSFELINYQELKKNALKQAILKAKEKATLIVNELDIKLVEVLEAEEILSQKPETQGVGHRYPNPFNAPLYMYSVKSRGSKESSILGHEIRFSVEVKVVFRIENKLDKTATNVDYH